MDLCEFEASIIYRARSRIARDTQRNPVSKFFRLEVYKNIERFHCSLSLSWVSLSRHQHLPVSAGLYAVQSTPTQPHPKSTRHISVPPVFLLVLFHLMQDFICSPGYLSTCPLNSFPMLQLHESTIIPNWSSYFVPYIW